MATLNPMKVKFTIAGVQHVVLDFSPETIGNALATLERFVREVRPALR